MSIDKATLYVDSRFTSPYAMSVFVTLVEKGIPFDMKTVDLGARENYQDDYSDLSLTCRVPTLSNGDFHLSESSAITEYLDECYAQPDFPSVYPEGMQERARARQIQAWVRSDFLEIREERSTEVIFYSEINSTPLSEAASRSFSKLISGLDNVLKDGTYDLFGNWCIADTEAALMLNRLILNGDNVPPKFVEYADYQWQRPSVQQWVSLSRENNG